MSQYYEVVNGPSTVEELQQICPTLHVDGSNIQYVINQDEIANGQYQHPNHQVIGIDQQTGAAVQLSGYRHHPPLVVDNCQQQGVYVLEAPDHSAQSAVAVGDIQQQQQLLQHQVQQVQQGQPVQCIQQVQPVQQVQQIQPVQQVQQVSTPQFLSQAQPQQQFRHQQAQAYYNSVPMPAQVQGNRLALIDTAVRMAPGQNMQVAAEEVTEHHTQHVAYERAEAPVGFANRLTQLVEHQQQQQQPHQQQQHILSQVVQASDNKFVTLADGGKMSVEDWQRMQEHQQQRAGVITLTRQNTHVGSPVMTTIMQQHRIVQVPHQEYAGPRRSYAKARIRTQNALVTNNTVQAIASPTVEHHRNLLQQHDNVISVGNQVANVQPQHTPEEVLQEQCQQTASSTQILILLPDGNQQLVNVSVPQGSCSLKEILEQVGLRMDGTVVINNSGTSSEVHLERTAVATVIKTEEIPVAKLAHQPDSSAPSEESSEEGGVPSSGPIVQPAQSSSCLPKAADNVLKQCSPARILLPGLLDLEDEFTVSLQNVSADTAAASHSRGPEPLHHHCENIIAHSGVTFESTQKQQRAVKIEESTEVKPVIKEEPKLIPGKLAVCHFCGYSSSDFFRCQRCRRKLPENCKSIPFPDALKKKTVKEGNTSEKCLPKVSVKAESTTDVPKGRVRGRPSKRTKSKLVEEPVCLTLSSDDEESTQSDLDSTSAGERLLNNGQRLSADDISYTTPDPEVTLSARGKEPVFPEEEDTGSDTGENRQTQGVKGGGRDLDMDGIIDGSIPGSYTLVQCRTVRIGSYKVVPKDRVLLSSVGIRIAVPAIEDDSKSVTLLVEISEIKKVLIHFGRGMPVLFLYIMPSAAARIRAALNMESKLGPYYDPSSQDETHKRITLLPERLHEDSKVALKNIFGTISNVLEELSNKEANDILVRASPKEVQNIMKKAIGMSPSKPKDEIQTILVYPPPPSKGGIPINTEDYACLGEDQFLNDVIIDFYLRYLTLSVLSEEDQARTHVFSSFFYKRLTTRPAKALRRSHPVEDDPKLSPAEKRHCRVKGWTKNINIFEKDFIIIPINEHCHWFLAIICFPGLRGSVRFCDNTPVVIPPVTKTKKVVPRKEASTVDECLKGSTLQIGSTTITPIKPTATITLDTCGEEGSDRDEAEADDDEMEQGTSEDEDCVSAGQPETLPVERHQLFSDLVHEEVPVTPTKPLSTPRGRGMKPVREPIKQPCILIFDSLAGASRSRVVATLRDYLRIEYKVKEGKEREFNKDTIKGSTPRVPQQTNFTDCGVYVLQYVESFFQVPIKDYYLPMKNLVNWFSEDVVNRKREEIQKLLLRLLEKSNVNIESLNLPKLSFSCNHSESETQEDSMCDMAVDAEASSLEMQPQEEADEGGLVFTCTEEEDYVEDSTDVAGESNAGNSSNRVSAQTNSSPDKVGGGDKRSLVNYADSDEEEERDREQGQSSMDVDNTATTVGTGDDGKRNNTMLFLKTKRIERHSTRGIDSAPLKKMRTGQIQSRNR